MTGINGSYQPLTVTDVSGSFGALQKLADDYSRAIAKNPALKDNAAFVARFNLSKEAVSAMNAASRMATPGYQIQASDVSVIRTALSNPMLSAGQTAQLNGALQAAQKASLVAEDALRLSDSLKLSQQALLKAQKAVATGSGTASQTVAIGELSRQLGNTLKTGNKLQTEIGSAVFSNNSIYAAANKGLSGAVNGVTPLTDVAGSVADLANAQLQAAKDFAAMQKVLTDPKATVAMKLTASAKATQSASSFIQRQDAMMKSISAADDAYLQQSEAYRRLTDKTRNAKFVVLASGANKQIMQKALHAAAIGGTSAAFVLSALSLPSLMVSTKTNWDKLLQTVDNPDSSLMDMADALANTTKAGAGAVYAVQGLNASFEGIMTAVKQGEHLGKLVAKAEGSVLVNNPLVAFSKTTFGKIMNFLLPIADAGMALADTMRAYHTFHDPKATVRDKARAVLDVGLDFIKVLTYMIPQTRAMRYAYIGASFAQMGLATWDFAQAIQPTMAKAGAAIVDAVTHPGETMKALGGAVQEGVMWVKKKVQASVEWVENLFEDPDRALKNIEASALAFERKLVEGTKKIAYKVVDAMQGKSPGTTMVEQSTALPAT